MEKKNNKKLFILAGILLLLVGVIGITFAYFSAGGAQEQANTFSSGCLNIELTNESASISLNNVYPITDIEGLEGTSYDFTIKNNCSTETNYQINLESLNEVANSLSADYIKVSLSSDTVDNVISILSDNTSVTPELEGAYESYNLYTASIGAGEEKTYHLKIWIDYDATVEEAAEKVYQSKINVIANPDTQVIDTLEAKFELTNKTSTANLVGNVTSATYCTTGKNICTPTTNVTISNNAYSVQLESKEEKQIVCTRLNGTSKIICSEPFTIEKTGSDIILANYSTLLKRTVFSTTVTEDTTGTIYYEDTNNGKTYYFAGNPTDNWVSFAGYYWRIIRINENGSIRLIYSGDAGNGPSTTGSSTNISTSTWNGNNWDNTYVGYMYSEAYQSDYPSVHANLYDSMAKSAVDVWYENNLIEYNDYLDQNVGFCGDRIPYVGSGFGDEDTYYGPFARLSSYQPTFECENGNDYYTTKESLSGNNALTYPIGLISADEVAYAGGVIEVLNQSYYLYTGQDYWLISPHSYVSNSAYVFMLNSSGALTSSYLDSFTPHGVRPVINLRADVTISSGNGTLNSPYVIGS